jgi:hypothetical protein
LPIILYFINWHKWKIFDRMPSLLINLKNKKKIFSNSLSHCLHTSIYIKTVNITKHYLISIWIKFQLRFNIIFLLFLLNHFLNYIRLVFYAFVHKKELWNNVNYLLHIMLCVCTLYILYKLFAALIMRFKRLTLRREDGKWFSAQLPEMAIAFTTRG